MKNIVHKARDIKPGEIVFDRSNRFTIKEVCVGAGPGLISFIDMDGIWHGVYHPDEYLSVGDYPLADRSVTDFQQALQVAFEWAVSSRFTTRDATTNR
jgi:hypothetical protein